MLSTLLIVIIIVLVCVSSTLWPLHCHKTVVFTCRGCLLAVPLRPSSGWDWAAGCSLESTIISIMSSLRPLHPNIYTVLTLSHGVHGCICVVASTPSDLYGYRGCESRPLLLRCWYMLLLRDRGLNTHSSSNWVRQPWQRNRQDTSTTLVTYK